MFVNFAAIWYISWSFGIFSSHRVYFVAIWYTYCSRFVMLYRENLAALKPTLSVVRREVAVLRGVGRVDVRARVHAFTGSCFLCEASVRLTHANLIHLISLHTYIHLLRQLATIII
jgi:hypothetical protein